jgi:magnesium chelatase accessory protein
MMAQWDLPALRQDLPRLATPLLLLVGKQDRTIRPTEARRLQAILPAARILALPGLGHLAHEEAPELVTDAILEALT